MTVNYNQTESSSPPNMDDRQERRLHDAIATIEDLLESLHCQSDLTVANSLLIRISAIAYLAHQELGGERNVAKIEDWLKHSNNLAGD